MTSYSYDLRGRILTVAEGSRLTRFTYDDAGQLETLTRPNGHILTYDYDAAHDLRTITDNFGNKITYTYDAKGNRNTEEIRDPGNTLTRSVSYAYDLRNRLDAMNAAGSLTDLLFDAVGNLKQEVDPNTHATNHTYDPLNRLTKTLTALSGTISYSYDKEDRLTQVQAPNGATTTYVYDDLGNLLSEVSPDTGTTSYTYDAAGNRTSMVDARGTLVSYAYDALNRLTAITYPTAALNRVFTYDAGVNQKGRLTDLTDGSGTTAYSYNAYGERIGEGRALSGQIFSTGYAFDAVGKPTTQIYPSSGHVITYTRNALGRVTGITSTLGGVVTSIASQIDYLPFGPMTSLTLGNGIVLGRLHDQQYRLNYLSDAGTSMLRDRSYTYDAPAISIRSWITWRPQRRKTFSRMLSTASPLTRAPMAQSLTCTMAWAIACSVIARGLPSKP